MYIKTRAKTGAREKEYGDANFSRNLIMDCVTQLAMLYHTSCPFCMNNVIPVCSRLSDSRGRAKKRASEE